MTIKVLIVDDHGILRAGLRALFAGEPDIQVVGEAEDGVTALRLTGELHPDVVLLDIGIPHWNGIEATKKIKELYPAVRVLILSLNEDTTLVRQAIENGASGYIVKRAVESELLVALRAVYKGDVYLHSSVTRALIDKAQPISDSAAPAEKLTEREIQVLQQVALGHTSRQIAALLKISVRTVEEHRRHIATKLGLYSPVQLTRYAMNHGLLKPETK